MSDTSPSPAVDPSLSILAALQELRDESRRRGEETAARFDKLDTKVDKLAIDDEALRLELRRLEQRQAGTDEDVRLMREEIRKDREARTTDKATMSDTIDAMRRFVEGATKANADAMARFDDASKKFETAAADISDVKTQNGKQDERLEKLEGKVDKIGTSIGTVATGVATLARWQDAWWIKVLLAVAIVAGGFGGGFYAAMQAAKTHQVGKVAQ